MKYSSVFFLLFASTLGARASAQQFDVDVGSTYGTPSSAFGAAAGVAGVWNGVPASQGTSPLLDVTGTPTNVTLHCSGPSSTEFFSNNPGTSGDDQSLMDDSSDPLGFSTWTFAGFAAGDYVLYTYALGARQRVLPPLVSVTGSPDPAQVVGGAWPGG
ncbi:MAG: hypothetical protein IPJ19_19065 [Planctomycetes bacterium]|nr:hypothetical protein [Planctomycetota bacterium]